MAKEVSCGDSESTHACGDLTSLKGDYLIATLLYGEVFTAWEDTLVVSMGWLEGRLHGKRENFSSEPRWTLRQETEWTHSIHFRRRVWEHPGCLFQRAQKEVSCPDGPFTLGSHLC